MRQKAYQSRLLITYLIMLTIILEVIFIFILNSYKIYKYKEFYCIMSQKNTCFLVIKKKEKKLLYKNSILYIKNKKIKFQIVEDNGIVITKNKEIYNEVLIKLNRNYPGKETLNVLLPDKKIKLLEIFKLIWEGD